MSVHRKDNRWVVRWRNGDRQRSRSFSSRRAATAFDRETKRKPPLTDYALDMLPGAEPEGAFRQAVKAWCDQERSIHTAMDETRIELVPKSDDDRKALLARLAEIHKTAARLERQLEVSR